MHFKYDATAEQDNLVVERVVELADRYDVEMTQISLAWLLTKVESPIVGATKLHHIEGAVKSLDVRLTADDIRYLEEPYVPHNLSGVMAVNKPVMSEEPVWVKQIIIQITMKKNIGQKLALYPTPATVV